MKLVITSLLTAGILWSCTPAGTDSETAETRSLKKGQSMVVDNESQSSILGIALKSPDHTTLIKASQAAEIEDILVNAGPITLFAPTNAAFEKLPEGTLEELTRPENKAKLRNILYYHAAPGNYSQEMLKDGMDLFIAQGSKLKIGSMNGKVTVNGANIVATIKASNGTIHVIDQVLLPPN
jgi:uncharacterized surface protein with fasciclin (FAS1) repeats